MKKIIIILIVVFALTGCNYDIVDLQYDYDQVICNYDGNKFILEIESWKDYEGEQIQVKSKDGTYLLSTNKCYLVERNK